MNDASFEASESADEPDGRWGDLDAIPVAEIKELFVVLSKALRAFQLYDANNPVFRRFLTNLREAFEGLWGEFDHVTVGVTEDAFTVGKTEVYRAESRSDSLAFLFYKDGIREITFLPGIEQDHLTPFLRVLQRARQVGSEGDDLLTILWEGDVRYFKYEYVDLLAEGVELPARGPGNTPGELRSVLEAEAPDVAPNAELGTAGEAGEQSEERPKSVSQEDFNPTLYAFDAREVDLLQSDIAAEMRRDLRTDVLNALFDRLEEPHDRERQSEILGVFQQLLPNFLSRGVLGGASRILRELHALERKDGPLDAVRRRQAEAILDEVSAPEAVNELVYALEDGSIRPDPRTLGALLGFLRSGALRPILHAAETSVVKEIRPALFEAVQGIAKRNPDALAGLFGDEDPKVVAGAARLTGKMKIAEAGPVMAELMYHEAAEVRLAAVEAATDLRASTAAGALELVLDDPDRDVRIAAARALGQLQYQPAADRLEKAVGGRELRNADITEKIAFFQAYARTAGNEAVRLLDHLLNGKGFLGRRESPEVRACAALALGKIDSSDAEEALEFALDEEDPVVRSAVNRALRREG